MSDTKSVHHCIIITLSVILPVVSCAMEVFSFHFYVVERWDVGTYIYIAIFTKYCVLLERNNLSPAKLPQNFFFRVLHSLKDAQIERSQQHIPAQIGTGSTFHSWMSSRNLYVFVCHTNNTLERVVGNWQKSCGLLDRNKSYSKSPWTDSCKAVQIT